jgi:hypothetical protein
MKNFNLDAILEAMLKASDPDQPGAGLPFVLVADGLKTLDGTVAFLYDVNLVVAAKDLPSIERIWHEAQAQHKKLYQAFEAAVESLR